MRTYTFSKGDEVRVISLSFIMPDWMMSGMEKNGWTLTDSSWG